MNALRSITDDITEVRYERLVSFGRFENERIGATARVPAEVHANDVLDGLRSWVEREIDQRQEVQRLEIEIDTARAELRELNRQVENARQRWEKAKVFLEKHGIVAEDYASTINPDEIPF